MVSIRRNNTCVGLLTLVVIAASFALRAAANDRLSGESMGTTWSVTISGMTPPNAVAKVQAELDLVDRLMSTWRDDSEVSRFNKSSDTSWFAVSAETAAVVEEALRISRQTDGAFDITVSPLIRLWNFETNTNRTTIPSDDAIESCRQSIGWQKLSVRRNPPALRKTVANLEINLSAIAKGYAVDRVAEALMASGCESFLVEVGGEIRTAGNSPRGRPWSVGIEVPTEGARSVSDKIEVVDQAMATSGDYRNFYVVDGKRYSHTIDPRTGRPIEHGLASVSVLAETCMEADAWATALSVLGPQLGRSVALKAKLDAQLTTRHPEGFTTTSILGNFPAESLDQPKVGPKPSGMVPVLIAALVVFLLAVGGMAVGVIISNKRLKGSCGGLAGLTDGSGQTACDLCAMPSAECRGEGAQTAPAGESQSPGAETDQLASQGSTETT